MNVRVGILRQALKMLKTHPVFRYWNYENTFKFGLMENSRSNFLYDHITGKGKIRERLAWWFKYRCPRPNSYEVRLIIEIFNLVHFNPPEDVKILQSDFLTRDNAGKLD